MEEGILVKGLGLIANLLGLEEVWMCMYTCSEYSYIFALQV